MLLREPADANAAHAVVLSTTIDTGVAGGLDTMQHSVPEFVGAVSVGQHLCAADAIGGDIAAQATKGCMRKTQIRSTAVPKLLVHFIDLPRRDRRMLRATR